MIKVELFISSSLNIEKFSKVLSRIGVISVSAMDMKIFGSEIKPQNSYRGVLRSGRQANKTKLEIILPEENKTLLFKMLKEMIGPEDSLTTQIFITPMKKVSSLQDAVLV